ncbi:PorP/SprF family type IX secretion system membrane protein [Pedobacter agri]|uniref:PorP/SprF family type IX secretion system membrane protein n=1 Tax=Pedobacter agri TaxID=454586 RepID=UPI00292E72F5|nr:PorP/SprF family type IX secretion system membrane protein [Pedobacter agri]
MRIEIYKQMAQQMTILRACFLLMILLLSTQLCIAQDLIYSQFFNAPNYLNPALNGQFEGDLRMSAIYRSQWTKVQGSLSNYSFAVDYQVPSFGGGFGLIMNKSSEGTAYISKTNFAGVYSYSIEFNENTISFGIQAGVTNRKIDYDKLVFPDQIDGGGIIGGGATSASYPAFNNKYFFDAGAGLNFVTGNFMAGFSAQHLNKPDESFTGSISKLPIRYGGHMSYMIKTRPFDHDDDSAFIPSVVIYNQAKINSFSAGVQYKNRNVNLGLWYRGDGKQQDAIVLSLIFDIFKHRDSNSRMRFGVSHDATTSRINYTNTGGTTEGAFVYEMDLPNRGNASGYNNRGSSYANKCYKFY